MTDAILELVKFRFSSSHPNHGKEIYDGAIAVR